MATTEDIRAEAVRRYSDPKSRATDFGRHASANEIAGFMDGAKWMASLPVTDEQVEAAAETLIARHWDGTGCGTHGANACSNCFGPSPMSAYEVARAVLEAVRGVQS